MDGILNVLKPVGMTSSDVVVLLRKLLVQKKIGHTGTLDPGAAGVLPIGIGKGTKLFDYIVNKEKVYIAEITLGCKTDSQDSFGVITNAYTKIVSLDEVNNTFQSFIGNIKQKPPMYSAIKYKGKKLYELARQGITIDLPDRDAFIYDISLLAQTEYNRYLIKVTCSKGTYIRTLCNDIGDALGCGAYMSFLLRTETGCFSIDQALTIEEITLLHKQGNLNSYIKPLDFPLKNMPFICVEKDYLRNIENGNHIDLSWIENTENINIENTSNIKYRIYCNDRFCGIGSRRNVFSSWVIAIDTLLI